MNEIKKEQLKEDAFYESKETDEIIYSTDCSNCCDALIYENTDICSRCLEHCDVIGEEIIK